MKKDNEIKVFKSERFGSIRTLKIDDEPWFVGKDVAKVLGYSRADNAIRTHVDSDDKLTHQISASGQKRNMFIINESGLYSLIFASKLDEAKQFKRWVTHEVLPSQRKNGFYVNGQEHLSEEEFKMLKLKAAYFDIAICSPDTYSITDTAKDFGMSGTKMNQLLCAEHIQYKKSHRYYLYHQYDGQGYVSMKRSINFDGRQAPRGSNYMRWTEKGRMFLIELLRSKNILMDSEKEHVSQLEMIG